jgi:hypothetical protein
MAGVTQQGGHPVKLTEYERAVRAHTMAEWHNATCQPGRKIPVPPKPTPPPPSEPGPPVELREERPPRSGPGATRAAWHGYAEWRFVPVEPEWTRGDIIAAVNQADAEGYGQTAATIGPPKDASWQTNL